MLWARSRPQRLLVLGAKHAFACDVVNRRVVADTIVSADVESDNVEALAVAAHRVSGLIDKRTGVAKALTVVVSDQWLVSVDLPWTTAMLRKADAHLHACSQLEFMGSDPAQLRVAIDNAPFGKPRLACAIPALLLEAINQLSGSLQLPVTSIRPLSAMVFECIQAQINDRNCAVAVIEDGVASLLVVRDRRVQQTRTHHVGARWVSEIESIWNRMQIRDPGLAELETLHVADLTNGAAMSPSVSALRMLPLAGIVELNTDIASTLQIAARATSSAALDWADRSPPLRRTQVVVSVAGLLLLSAGLWTTVRDRQEMLASVAGIAALEQPVRTSVVYQSRTAKKASEQELQQLQSQLDALDLPIDDLLIAIRPPNGLHAAVLGIEISAPKYTGRAGAPVRVVGEAESSEEMTQYVSYLARTPPFIAANLTRHETVEPAARGIYRFTVEATWAP